MRVGSLPLNRAGIPRSGNAEISFHGASGANEFVDRTGLPKDVESKGFVRQVVQNLVIRRDNVEFLREKLYSPSLGQTFLAPLPPGYRGAFGPDIATPALELAYGANVTFPKIRAFLEQHRIRSSRGKVASLLTEYLEDLEDLHAEAEAVRTSCQGRSGIRARRSISVTTSISISGRLGIGEPASRFPSCDSASGAGNLKFKKSRFQPIAKLLPGLDAFRLAQPVLSRRNL
jgi:hypothetical protein